MYSKNKLITIICLILLIYIVIMNQSKNYKLNYILSINKIETTNATIRTIKINKISDSVLNPEFRTYLNFKLEPKDLCKFNNNKFIFIYIFTSVKSFSKRQIIRNTYGNKKLNLFNFELVFIIGKTLNKTIETRLNKEQLKYNDLIQGNFIDSYRNLSYKSLTAWKWINLNCKNSNYVLKLDDDILLNTYKLKKMLIDNNQFKSNSNSFICQVLSQSGPVFYDKTCKTYVTDAEYNSNLYKNINIHGLYPPYCKGIASLMTPDLISKLFEKALDLKLFWIDDAYVGILGKYINAQHENIPHLYSNNRSLANDILFIDGADTIDDMSQIWNLITKK